MIDEPIATDPDVRTVAGKAALVTLVPSDLSWRPYTVNVIAGGTVALFALTMNRPVSPTVIPPMSAAVPLFWTKKVLVVKTLIPPAPTNPRGLDVPLFVASAASRPAKLGSASSWLRIEPLAIQTSGALNNTVPARPPAAFVITMPPLSVFTSTALPPSSVRLSEAPASVQLMVPRMRMVSLLVPTMTPRVPPPGVALPSM